MLTSQTACARRAGISIEMDFESYRHLLLSVAYRMLGRVADAEDIVQDAYLRTREIDWTKIDNPRAFLCTIVTRMCIDHLRSAPARREISRGVSLPEPAPPSWACTVSDSSELAESLSIAFLTMLQNLAPIERAAFLLHEVFDFDYTDVARAIGKTPVGTRQIVSRARKTLYAGKAKFNASPAEAREVVERFITATRTGDLAHLLEMLAPDVVLHADGGAGNVTYGRIRALTRPIRGRERVARFTMAARAQAPADRPIRSVRSTWRPLSSPESRAHRGALSFDVADGPSGICSSSLIGSFGG